MKMSPPFVLGRENVLSVAEVVNRLLKADCTDFTLSDVIKLDPYGYFLQVSIPTQSQHDQRPYNANFLDKTWIAFQIQINLYFCCSR